MLGELVTMLAHFIGEIIFEEVFGFQTAEGAKLIKKTALDQI
jgi:hypothetical protein